MHKVQKKKHIKDQERTILILHHTTATLKQCPPYLQSLCILS